MALPFVALPGQLLGPASKYTPGPGTHIYESNVYASIAGPVSSTTPPPPSKPSSAKPTPSTSTKTISKTNANANALPLLTIERPPPTNSVDLGILGVGSGGGSNILPEVDGVVLARVTRIGARFATVEILVVGEEVCRESFQGVVRREDVRSTEKDKVKIEEVFRVGDLVRGVVISLGDQSNYYLSTAQNEYGVVMASSEAGNLMYPISWKEFRDPKTGRTETRKVAKPF